jgi:Arc/MetJ-type ribon-helix-helix transcriptional regulator
MSTLNVKIPDEMEDDIEAFLERNPHYLNKSELVRDALRHVIESNGSDDRGQPSDDDPLLSAPAVTVDEPVAEGDIDDVVYGSPDE